VSLASAFGHCALAGMLSAGFASAAFAQGAPPAAAAPQNPLPGTSSGAGQDAAPDAAKDPQSCLAETGDYVSHGNAVTYVIGLENKCDKRLKCTIDAYVVGAKGPASGPAILILGAASSGAGAKKSYAMKVRSAGGTAQVSRDCKAF
jgi:hypothetical protein